MDLPATDEITRTCLNADSSTPENCKELDPFSVKTYPASNPPKKSDLTLLWAADGQHSEYMEHVNEYLVN